MDTMIKPETVYLSKRGMKDLKKQVSQLERQLDQAHLELRGLDKTDSREDRFERIERLARIESVEAELFEKKNQLENSKALPRKRDALRVALGSVVDLIDSNGRIMRYTLVNSIEANPSDGRISVNSPLGKSLLGRSIEDKSKNNVINWRVGVKSNNLRLVKIN